MCYCRCRWFSGRLFIHNNTHRQIYMYCTIYNIQYIYINESYINENVPHVNRGMHCVLMAAATGRLYISHGRLCHRSLRLKPSQEQTTLAWHTAYLWPYMLFSEEQDSLRTIRRRTGLGGYRRSYASGFNPLASADCKRRG